MYSYHHTSNFGETDRYDAKKLLYLSYMQYLIRIKYSMFAAIMANYASVFQIVKFAARINRLVRQHVTY